MTTFAKSTFSAASYAAFRPTYPSTLYNTVLAYHRGPKTLCLDLGCGTGIATREMGAHFARVVGTDPSPGMIRQASSSPATPDNVAFREGGAESSPFLDDAAVDCVVAAQASHWFDYARLWPELRRLVRRGGTVAFWGYKDPVLVDYPRATAILDRISYGDDPHTLGPYWSMPGRRYVQEKLRVIQPPEGEGWFGDVQRVEYEPACEGKGSGEGRLFMAQSVSLGGLKAYYRTWSSFHGWQVAHPGDVARERGGRGDLMDWVVDEMAEEDDFFKDEGNVVNMEWGSGLVMCRRQ